MSSTTVRIAAAELLLASDPLSDEACCSLVGYREEDGLVDFKVSFEPKVDKSWIELGVDCAALANTDRGFIVFGVRDQTWEPVGINEEVSGALRDTKKVLEKINRGLTPSITRARTRIVKIHDREFALLHVPASIHATHIFESNRDWTNAAPETQIVTVTKVVGARGEAGVQVVDAPPNSDLIGRSLSFTAKTLADRINLYSALLSPKDNQSVDVRMLFEAFAVRQEQEVAPEHREWLALYSLLRHAPVFYWLRDLRVAEARRLIDAAFNAGTNLQRAFILNYAGFYGESFYRKLYNHMPAHSVRSLEGKEAVFRTGPSKYAAQDELRATEFARKLSRGPDQQVEYELEKLDCSLYAPFGERH
jgi:hypothetical protein